MTRMLTLRVVDWLRGDDGADETGALTIIAGPDNCVLTEVDDTLNRTVRPHVYLPATKLAEWLLVNWWRLRWEPRPANPPPSWQDAHIMAAIGGGNAWPSIEFSSDGDFVHLQMSTERRPDAAAIRYLNGGQFDVPARDFESAVDRFLDQVEERRASTGQPSTLHELREELRLERENPEVAERCRLQALAGLDPGSADEAWFERVGRLGKSVGTIAAAECLTVLGDADGTFDRIDESVDAIRKSRTRVSLGWRNGACPQLGRQLPWQVGEEAARALRASLGLTGAISQRQFSELLDTGLPIEPNGVEDGGLGGAFVGDDGRASTVVFRHRETSQRFDLARVMGCAVLCKDEPLLPVTRGNTAMQKFERSFATEFLCPWAELDDATDEDGTDDDVLEDVAERYGVSPLLVRTSLVNKGKIPRYRLRAFS